MNEASKTRLLCWGEKELSYLQGRGIDIGCGSDPVNNNVQHFDLVDGDANRIGNFVTGQYDYVFSSHCLEHMDDPKGAILEWWRLVKSSGYLFIIVPDEDLYEQGVFPSRFNLDHKHTFTISKRKSWSRVSINVIDLISILPNARLVNLELQDIGYDRKLYYHGYKKVDRICTYAYNVLLKSLGQIISKKAIAKLPMCCRAIDQTRNDGALAQIQFVVQKTK